MKRIIFLVFFVFSGTFVFCDNYPTGASNLGIGGSSVAVNNLWSSCHNQGSLGYFEGIQAGIYYENRLFLPEFGLKSAVFAMNLKPGAIALNFSSFGFSKFSDNKIGLAYGLKLADFIAVGVQIDYFIISQDSYYGNISAFSGEIGIYANPFENFYIGAHVFNPWRTKIAEYQNERMPTIFRLGVAYDFSEKVKTSVEVEKDLDNPAIFKTGIQYEPIKNFVLRTGVAFSENNFYPAFGLAYTFKNITLDVAFQSHTLLGMKSGASLSYRFK